MPRRRFPYDRYDVPLLDVTLQAQGGAPKEFSGTVDSGASTTVLSIKNAERLGLNPEDLRQAPDAIVARSSRSGTDPARPPATHDGLASALL
jgi:Aspartyl protease